MREVRERYNDRAEIWTGAIKRMDAEVHLTRYGEPIEVATGSNAVFRAPEKISWDGQIVGLSRHDFDTLSGLELELRLPNGRSGSVWLADTSGLLRCAGEPPF